MSLHAALSNDCYNAHALAYCSSSLSCLYLSPVHLQRARYDEFGPIPALPVDLRPALNDVVVAGTAYALNPRYMEPAAPGDCDASDAAARGRRPRRCT